MIIWITYDATQSASTPSFDRLEDDRLHRKQRLAAALRLFAHYGFDDGVAGHCEITGC